MKMKRMAAASLRQDPNSVIVVVFNCPPSVNAFTDHLILDEMLTAGDAGFRERAGGLIENLAGEHRTILVASHNMGMVRKICTRVIWLEEGKIRMNGAPLEVTDAYLEDTRRRNQDMLTAGG